MTRRPAGRKNRHTPTTPNTSSERLDTPVTNHARPPRGYATKEDIETAKGLIAQGASHNEIVKALKWRAISLEELEELIEKTQENLLLRELVSKLEKSGAHLRTGNAYYHEGKYEEAIAEYRKAKDIDAEAGYGLAVGASLYRLGQYNLAIFEFDEFLHQNPQEEVGHLWRGAAYSALGKWTEALRDLRRAIDLDAKLRESAKNVIVAKVAKYYNLELKDFENDSPCKNLPISKSKLKKIFEQTADTLLDTDNAKPFKPLTLRQLEAVKARAEKNSWNTREERGWPYHTNAFQYLHLTYGRWIPGLTRENLAAVDRSLYLHVIRKISLEGEPWFDFPTGAEARLRAITDSTERLKVQAVREFKRAEKARQIRNRKNALGD